MKRYDNNVRDLRTKQDPERQETQREESRKNDTLKFGKASQSPMAENVGDINLHKGAGDDTDTQGHKDEVVQPRNKRAADINGVEWRGE